MRLQNLLYSSQNPFRHKVLERTRRRRLGTFAERVRLGAVSRPHYAYCMYHSAVLAQRLGYDEISVIEFGVAGGNGLLVLEQHAEECRQELGIKIQLYGFDTGAGLPAPSDYRDLPYHWKPGFFAMDVDALKRQLRTATLVLGDIAETSKSFFREHDPAPIAAVMHDFDFYSSTRTALDMLDADERYRLPRMFCYFDDILGDETALYNDFTGERLAINEYNAQHETRKLSPAYHLTTRARLERWYHQIYLHHDFEHSRYNDFVSDVHQQLPLRSAMR
jgi:hypothetical protein